MDWYTLCPICQGIVLPNVGHICSTYNNSNVMSGTEEYSDTERLAEIDRKLDVIIRWIQSQ